MSLEYHNLMEEIVLMNVDSIMEASGVCCCDACKSDVIAYTLNHLPPHYVATNNGRLMVKLQNCELQARADVVAAISEAVHLVADSPRHDRA